MPHARALSLAAALIAALVVTTGTAFLALAAPPDARPVVVAGSGLVSTPHYGGYVEPRQITATIRAITQTATAVRLATSGTLVAATQTALARGTAVLTSTPTITPTIVATITATPGVTTTPTVTPTLPPEWGVDALCRCHVPPLPPGPECERLKALYVRDVLAAWATQTTLARGTETDTPTATSTPSSTPSPLSEATPTVDIATDTPTVVLTPAPTWTARVVTVVVTATPPPIVRRVWLPMLIVRRPRR